MDETVTTEIPAVSTLVLCQFCHNPFHPHGLRNHERTCGANPAPRPRKRRVRKICPECRTMIDAGAINRHLKVCKGKGTTRQQQEQRQALTDAAPVHSDTTDLLIELLFPEGMPSNATFVSALRKWIECTDRLVALSKGE